MCSHNLLTTISHHRRQLPHKRFFNQYILQSMIPEDQTRTIKYDASEIVFK